jgi:hypothetical protein
VARALGDPSAHYALYQATATRTCGGCNLYNSAILSDPANIMVNFGGVLFTQILGWTAILLMGFSQPRIAPSWMLWTVIVITWLGDLILQLVQGLTTGVPVNLPRGPDMSYTDFTAVIWFAHRMTGLQVGTLRLILLTAGIVYSELLALAVLWAVSRRRSPSQARSQAIKLV